jgi:hypothetical protein
MPKVGQATCLDVKAHRAGVQKLLADIAKANGKSRGDVVIAYHEDISVYAIRMWLCRPIPKRHWSTLTRLSGYSLEQIRAIARQHFSNAGSTD